MDILKIFNLNNTNFQLNIQGTLEDPLFQANQIGKILDIKNINQNLTDFNSDEKVLCSTYTLGGIQETTFITELGLYKLLGRCRKPKAGEFQKWMANTIKEIRITGTYKLKQENEIDKKIITNNYELINHKNLIKAYDNKNIIYICKLKEENEKTLIKIGSSQNIKERIYRIANEFDNVIPILLDIIEIDNYKKYETHLHNHEFIKKYYIKTVKKDQSISKETYLTTEKEYNEFIKIINSEKSMYQKDLIELEKIKFNNLEKEIEKEKIRLEYESKKIERENIEFKKKELEIEILKLKIENRLIEKNDVQKYTDYSSNDEFYNDEFYNDELNNDELDNDELDNLNNDTLNFIIKKRNNGIRSPKVFQYNPDNLYIPIKEFDSPSEVERQLVNLDISPSCLRNANKENMIYKDYRWFFLKRNDILPEKIPDTVNRKHKSTNIEYIAMIDIKKTKIIEVFSSQKEAVESRNLKSRSFTRAIKQQSISSGHYWNYFDKCSDEMKKEYLLYSKLPEKYIHNSGKKVQKIDPQLQQVIKTYNSNRDVIKKYQMSNLTLKKISETGEIYKNFIWKII
jgi:prophage antirepressor-like protein